MTGLTGALEALSEDGVALHPLSEADAKTEIGSPTRAAHGVDLLPHMLDADLQRASPLAAPCSKCGSRLWAAFALEICPMCGHLLPLKP
mmetsp:Transcript_10637/g.25020  ORF Transcript_10637/g.25020 Transcript_10637/m.25020 type:complete len:89 (+) Transcript_10637:198-464(+)